MAKRRRQQQHLRKGSGTVAETRGWNWRLVALLAAVFVVKLIVLSQLQHHPLLEPDGGVDSAEYVRLARRVMGGDLWLAPGLYYLSPLYIYFLAAALSVSDSFTFVRVAQIALGTAAVACIFVSARRWFGTRAAWMAAVLAGLTGVFTFYEIVVFQSSIDVFLTAAGLALLAIGPEGGELAAGLVFGLQFLNRPNVAIAIGGTLLVMLVARWWRAALWMAAGVAIAVAPVAVRNAVVTHDLALTSSQGGLNFYIGNHDGATGQYVAVPGVRANMAGQAEDTRKVAETAAGRPLSDGQVSSYFTGLAVDWIRQHPGAAAKLFVRKLALTLSARHQWLDFSYPYYAHDTGSLLAALVVGPWLLVPLGLAGAALLVTGSPRPSGSPGSSGSTGSPGSGFSGFTGSGFAGSGFVLVVFASFYALSVALFFVAERYRLPLFVPLCVLSGGAVDRTLQAFRKPSSTLRSPASARVAIALGVAGAIVAAWPHHLDDGRYEERLRLSKALMNRHEYDAATAELQAAYALRPADSVTEFNLGMALVSGGRAQEGIAHVRHAVDAGVPMKGARYALANAMLVTGDRDGAAALLRTFTPLAEDDAESCYRVGMLAVEAGAPDVARRYLQRALELRPGWPEAAQALQQLR